MPGIFRIFFCFIYIWVGVGESGEMWYMYVCVCVSRHICVNSQINVAIVPHLTIKCIFRNPSDYHESQDTEHLKCFYN